MNQIYRSMHSKSFWFRLLVLLRYCYRRVSEEDLPNVAGNMTFTAILGLVPTLILLTMLPQFEMLKKMLEIYFARGMIPGDFSRTIVHYLNEFSGNASNVSGIGIIFLLFSTITMIYVIEGAFNKIWNVSEPRPLPNRILLYIAIMILGPLVLGVSLTLTYQLFVVANNLVNQLPYRGAISYTFLSVLWSTITFSFLYHVVPYRIVSWKDAIWGGLFAAITITIAKRVFGFFILYFASYEKIYGPLSAIPIFLLWMYIAALIILSGAVLTAALPDFREKRWRRKLMKGSEFSDAVRLIYILYLAQKEPDVKMKYLEAITRLGVNRLERVLNTMRQTQWITSHHPHSINWRKQRISHTLEEWTWVGNTEKIRLADVYRLFVYENDNYDPISRKVNEVIDQNLSETLSEYFTNLNDAEQNQLLLQFK